MKRRTFLTLAGLAWLASVSPAVISATFSDQPQLTSDTSISDESLTFYIDPSGDDTWSGRLEAPNADRSDGPFATLQRARDAIRQVKQLQGGLEQPITVFLRDGTYFLSETLVFISEDSGTADFPITYRAYPNENPIISGGRPITNWNQEGDLWVAKLPEVEEEWNFRLLRVGEDWAIRARYPNFDPAQPLTEGWLFAQKKEAFSESKKFGRSYIGIASEQFPNWQNWSGAEIHVFMKRNFGNSIFPVADIDPENQALLGNFKSGNYPVGRGNRFFIENVREALDSPGEWYLDSENRELLYIPRESEFPNLEVVAPARSRLIVFQGNPQENRFVEYISLENLTFKDTDYTLAKSQFGATDAAIWISTARHCAIADCRFTTLGGYGVRLEQRSQENRLIRNEMTQLGQGGILLLGRDLATQPRNNLIAANHIHDCGKIYKHVAGVFVKTGSDNRIIHNRIERMPRYGVSLKSSQGGSSRDNTVEYNQIFDTNLETADTGAIESLGRDRQSSGNIIRYNHIKNVVGMGTTPKGKILSPYYTWGIYLDDYSSGTTIYGNIVVNTVRGALMIHGGRDNLVENNVFVDGAESQMQLQPKDQFMEGNIFRHNVVVFNNPEAKLWLCRRNWRESLLQECDYNLYWHAGSLNLDITEKEITPLGDFSQWQSAGFDTNSLTTNPLLIPEAEDSILLTGSPAFLLGFTSIPTESIGVDGFEES